MRQSKRTKRSHQPALEALDTRLAPAPISPVLVTVSPVFRDRNYGVVQTPTGPAIRFGRAQRQLALIPVSDHPVFRDRNYGVVQTPTGPAIRFGRGLPVSQVIPSVEPIPGTINHPFFRDRNYGIVQTPTGPAIRF